MRADEEVLVRYVPLSCKADKSTIERRPCRLNFRYTNAPSFTNFQEVEGRKPSQPTNGERESWREGENLLGLEFR